MLRDNLVHGLGNRGHQRMRSGRERRQLAVQGFRPGILGQAVAEQLHGLGIAFKGAIGQRHDPGTDVPHGGHVERPAQFGGTTPGIECGDDVDGVAGMP